MQALVTGGSGFIGSEVISQLTAQGIRVRALLRKTSHRHNLQGLDYEVVLGDLSDLESLKAVFWADGMFVPDALADINKILRDHRTNDIAIIDPQLLILLERLTSLVSPGDTLHVISGYRSPLTNQTLADQSDGVAKHSLHMDGQAIDIRIPGQQSAEKERAKANHRSDRKIDIAG